LIPNIVATVKGVAGLEEKSLTKIAEARTQLLSTMQNPKEKKKKKKKGGKKKKKKKKKKGGEKEKKKKKKRKKKKKKKKKGGAEGGKKRGKKKRQHRDKIAADSKAHPDNARTVVLGTGGRFLSIAENYPR